MALFKKLVCGGDDTRWNPAAGGRPFPLPNVSVVEQLTGEKMVLSKQKEDRVPPELRDGAWILVEKTKQYCWSPRNLTSDNQSLSDFCQEMLLLAGPAAA
ncbi:hypothetical protein N7530_012455 [Penicillium desertorum]|jgi:hypothetical protein|uniref:Uncharacterized protein n=1 Tax=Penicillium desertorum TaxID=1303715 RepID=A0A9X0BGK4_9EURO|nr:hypothetical protein N7530_012455 [Penicillium desertorum]